MAAVAQAFLFTPARVRGALFLAILTVRRTDKSVCALAKRVTIIFAENYREIAGKLCARFCNSALNPFHKICTPMHTSRNDDSRITIVIPFSPRIAASRSANP
jgi:hypothetical protein